MIERILKELAIYALKIPQAQLWEIEEKLQLVDDELFERSTLGSHRHDLRFDAEPFGPREDFYKFLVARLPIVSGEIDPPEGLNLFWDFAGSQHYRDYRRTRP